MICPRCGHEMNDDMLYCEKCGEEIQFVPDFEPEIEQSISDTLSEINLKDFEGEFSDGNNGEYVEEYTDEYSDEFYEEYSDEYNDETVYNEEFQNNDYSDNNYSNEEFAEDYTEENAEEYLDEYTQAEYSDDLYSDNEFSQNQFDDEYYEDEYTDEYYDEYDDDEYYDDEAYLDEIDPFDDNYESHILRNFLAFLKKSKLKWVILAGIVIIAVAVVIVSVKITNKFKTSNSVDYQIELAASAASEGDYKTAIEYMEKAISLNPKDSSKKFLLADYYFANKEDEKAILMFWEIISEGGSNSQDAYRKVINYYITNQDYAMVNDILSNCEDSIIKEEFAGYATGDPVFSLKEGTYEDEISLELSGPDLTGTIYYSLDGNEPTTESDIYVGPLQINKVGIYTVSAIYVNNYGIKSNVVRKTYTIDRGTPKAPNVLLEAGTYNIPMLIEVDVPDEYTVYYTTDGSEPTLASFKYSGPIPMPIGDSNFMFKTVNMEGMWSEITDVSYSLKLKSSFDIESINNCLLCYNFILGKSVDLEGHLLGNASTRYEFQVSSAIAYYKDNTPVLLEHSTENEEVVSSLEQVKAINTKDINIYYLVGEKNVDIQGNSIFTGTYFLCNVETGQLFKAIKSEDGYYQFAEEITPEMYTIPVNITTENTENTDNIQY